MVWVMDITKMKNKAVISGEVVSVSDEWGDWKFFPSGSITLNGKRISKSCAVNLMSNL